MRTNDMSFVIAGEAGQGIETSGAGICRALARSGLQVFGLSDHRSRIRGGHNFFQVRVHTRPCHSHSSAVHLVAALNAEAIGYHRTRLVPGGGLLYDEREKVDAAALAAAGIKPMPLPLTSLIKEHGGTDRMRNTMALAALFGVTGMPLESMTGVIEEAFARKGADTVQSNLRVAQAAYERARDRYGADFPFRLAPVPGAPPLLTVNGNEALALGAMLGGCRFVSGYPMSPGTSILQFLSARAGRYGIVAKHTEDEIAAVCMAIGAAHAGVRAMVPTSGGGFSLMVEAVGLAGMTETPLVVVDVQRPGPSTGLPTRTAQEDLGFLLHASQGEFPRIVLAPGSIEECFATGIRAFNLAERYQTVVLVLSDAFLANSIRTVPPTAFDRNTGVVARGELLTDRELEQLTGPYLRHRFTDSGISPRALPGHPKAVYATSSDEHDESGNISEEAGNRIRMGEKRMRKLEAARQEPPLLTRLGPDPADLTVIGWGSTLGPAREALELLQKEGRSCNYLHLGSLWPFPSAAVTAALAGSRRTLVVEQNSTGQLAGLLRAETGRTPDGFLGKYDGRPFSPEEIVTRVKSEVGTHG